MRAIQSKSWPAVGAKLQFSAIWGTLARVDETLPRVADGVEVKSISTLLEPAGRIFGQPVRLSENAGIAFQGCITLGKGFLLSPEEAQQWIAKDTANRKVLFPYLGGDDVTSRPDLSASRWVIDFNGLTEDEAAKYTLPFARVLAEVKPERAVKEKSVRDAPWWLFLRPRPAMRAAIADLREALVITLVSKTVMPVRVATGKVFSQLLGVFAIDSFGDQAILSSSVHQAWAIKYASTLETRVRYTPSDVFETLPRPALTERLCEIGKVLDTERREIMLRRNLGLTDHTIGSEFFKVDESSGC